MIISVDINEVLRDFLTKLKKTYTKYTEKEAIARLLHVINAVTVSFKSIPDIAVILANHYQHKLTDIQQWLARTEWSQSGLTESKVNALQNQLVELNLIDKKSNFTTLVTQV